MTHRFKLAKHEVRVHTKIGWAVREGPGGSVTAGGEGALGLGDGAASGVFFDAGNEGVPSFRRRQLQAGSFEDFPALHVHLLARGANPDVLDLGAGGAHIRRMQNREIFPRSMERGAPLDIAVAPHAAGHRCGCGSSA